MAFNNDVGGTKLFGQIYELVMGKQSDGFTVLEVTYSIGLTFGILVFLIILVKNDLQSIRLRWRWKCDCTRMISRQR